MQEFPQPLLTLRDNLYTIIASILSGGAIVAVINWLTGRRKASAEVFEIHASTTRIEVEAREASTRTIMAAQARIVELVDINSELQRELAEACRERDDFEFQLGQQRLALEQLQTVGELREHFIQQLEAANKLGVQLRDLPPEVRESLRTKTE